MRRALTVAGALILAACAHQPAQQPDVQPHGTVEVPIATPVPCATKIDEAGDVAAPSSKAELDALLWGAFPDLRRQAELSYAVILLLLRKVDRRDAVLEKCAGG